MNSRLLSIEKALSCGNYKPLMMRSNIFMDRYISFAYSEYQNVSACDSCTCTWQSVQNLGKFQTVKYSNWPLLATFRLACTVSIAVCKSRQSQEEQRTVLYFGYANDNIHQSINPLGLIFKGLKFSDESKLVYPIASRECCANSKRSQ